MVVKISKEALKGRDLVSLPSFDIDSITDNQQQVIVDVLLNEYHKADKHKEEGDNASK